ncbi:MAG: cysteine--tRNA ligase [Candidatus Yanofskybacteria bacterium]|nr:cysteine--tRNA ligase [Candidatus Yanofskybacteria bacterium]
MKIYNTLGRKIEEFGPQAEKVRMFVCGPTVYDFIHIGNARTFVVFDMVAKYLRHRGYRVSYIQNITDVDDKILDRAMHANEDPEEYARKFEKEFYQDAKALGITAVDKYARATDHIDAIIKQIQALLDKGYAYEISDGIYFDLSKFKNYGKLSGRTSLQDDDAVSRIDENPEKRNPGDFALWKRSSRPDEPAWQSPWFPGRPGWHIEDTAITETYFGPQYDIHGGGRDLIFPHHEAEIAQQEAASGLMPFVKHWMHVEFLVNKAKKMSKSMGNFATAREVIGKHSRETVRFFLLSAHYRSPLDFSEETLQQAEAGVARIGEFLDRLKFFEDKNPLAHKSDKEVAEQISSFYDQIIETLDDDFNTPKAIGLLFDVIRLGNQFIDEEKIDLHSVKKILNVFDIFHGVFGIIPLHTVSLPDKVKKLVQERQTAKERKDYSRADEIRGQIEGLGYQVDDTKYGPLIKK